MAVVYRFPDRTAAEPETKKAGQAPGGQGARAAEVIILPCIRRERIDARQSAGHDQPTQLQA